MSKFTQKIHRVGELSSKYAYDRTGEQFEKDIQNAIERHKKNYTDLVNFAKEKGLTPLELKKMLIRLIEEFDI